MPLNPTGSDQPGRLIKRSFSLAGHRTSVALETEFWDVLIDVARSRSVTLAELVAKVDAARGDGAPLASSLRVLALRSVRDVTARDHPAPVIGR